MPDFPVVLTDETLQGTVYRPPNAVGTLSLIAVNLVTRTFDIDLRTLAWRIADGLILFVVCALCARGAEPMPYIPWLPPVPSPHDTKTFVTEMPQFEPNLVTPPVSTQPTSRQRTTTKTPRTQQVRSVPEQVPAWATRLSNAILRAKSSALR